MELLRKLDKTPEDINHLLAQHKRLAYHVLTTMGLLDNQDAESAAWEGLWDAINTFDVFSKNEFSTYAYKVIRNAILNELRKDTATKNIQCISVDFMAYPNQTAAAADTDVQYIYDIFNDYITTRSGVTKNVLLIWYSTGFDNNATNIANVCACSTSYVCRVQSAFRAYLATRLRGD